MSNFTVRWNLVKGQSNNILAYSNNLRNYKTQISNVMNSLPLSSNASQEIKKNLRNTCISIENMTNKMRTMGTSLNSIADTYMLTEKNLLGVKTEISEPSNEKNDFSWWTWNDTWKLFSKVGIVGSGISAIGQLITGGISWENGLSIASGAVETVKNIAKAIPNSGASFDWKTLFGFNAAITKDTPKNFCKAFGENLEKYRIGNAKTVHGKVEVVAKWAGSILTVAETFYDNFFNDTENNSTERKIAETLNESAIKIGENFLISAGVTAGLAALGAVGTPVVAVGVITVGVTWAVDKVCEYFTGKDLAEFVSDTVLDFGENVANFVGDAAKTVSDTVTGWWNKVFG